MYTQGLAEAPAVLTKAPEQQCGDLGVAEVGCQHLLKGICLCRLISHCLLPGFGVLIGVEADLTHFNGDVEQRGHLVNAVGKQACNREVQWRGRRGIRVGAVCRTGDAHILAAVARGAVAKAFHSHSIAMAW